MAEEFLLQGEDYRRLRTLPGVSPNIALMVIAESGDLYRFGHYRQYLNFCGFNLCATQSGLQQGRHKLSKRGNTRLRYAYWLAALNAIQQSENDFCLSNLLIYQKVCLRQYTLFALHYC